MILKKTIKIDITVKPHGPMLDLEAYQQSDGEVEEILMSTKQVGEMIRDTTITHIENFIEQMYTDDDYIESCFENCECENEDYDLSVLADVSIKMRENSLK